MQLISKQKISKKMGNMSVFATMDLATKSKRNILLQLFSYLDVVVKKLYCRGKGIVFQIIHSVT